MSNVFTSITCNKFILAIKHYILKQVLLQYTCFWKWQNMLGFYSFSVNEILFQYYNQLPAC